MLSTMLQHTTMLLLRLGFKSIQYSRFVMRYCSKFYRTNGFSFESATQIHTRWKIILLTKLRTLIGRWWLSKDKIKIENHLSIRGGSLRITCIRWNVCSKHIIHSLVLIDGSEYEASGDGRLFKMGPSKTFVLEWQKKENFIIWSDMS